MGKTVRMRLTESDTYQLLNMFEQTALAQGWDNASVQQVRNEVTSDPSNAKLILSKYVDDPDRNLLQD